MLFKISRGGVEGVDPDQDAIVYLVSSVEAVAGAGLAYVFTDGNAAKLISSFHTDPDLMTEKVDWSLMGTRYWHNTDEDGDRVRRRMAEFLVHRALAIELVAEIAVRRESIAARVLEMLRETRLELPVTVRPDWYF